MRPVDTEAVALEWRDRASRAFLVWLWCSSI